MLIVYPYGKQGYLLQPHRHDAIDVFDMDLIEGTPVHFEAISLDQLLEIKSGDARSGNANQDTSSEAQGQQQ